MDSYLSRLSQLLTIYLCGLGVCGLWTYAGAKFQEFVTSLDYSETVALSGVEPAIYGLHPYYNLDAIRFKPSIKVDLRDGFTWSTNILFAYLVASYKTEYRPRNEVVIWDRIVGSANQTKIDFSGPSKYYFQDLSRGHIKGGDISFTLRYCQLPLTGFLHKHNVGRPLTVKVPEEYPKTRLSRTMKF